MSGTTGGKNGEVNDFGFLLRLIFRLAPDPSKVREYVNEARKENPDLNRKELADFLGDEIVWTYTKQGAALALPGAVPGLGTVTQIAIETGAVSADIALMIRNQSYLVFVIGNAFGIRGRETLMQDTLICIGLWTKALNMTKSGAIRMGTKIIEANFRKKFPGKILQGINKKVGTTVLTKYGTKRGGVALGHLIPFGVGVAVGGGFNYLTMKRFKISTIRYFELKQRN